jgi:hypothetical protein
MRTPTPQGSHGVVSLSPNLLPPCVLTVLSFILLPHVVKTPAGDTASQGCITLLQHGGFTVELEGWDEEAVAGVGGGGGASGVVAIIGGGCDRELQAGVNPYRG